MYYNIYRDKFSQFAMKCSRSSFRLNTEIKELFLFNFDELYGTDIRQTFRAHRVMLYSLAGGLQRPD